MNIRSMVVLALSLLIPLTACQSTNQQHTRERVLFVGNSLTYYGNVPALYASLAVANGRPATSDMIVEAGATLTQRVADGSVARALSARKYNALVIQERGGDLLCSFGPDSCTESRAALSELAALANQHGVEVIMLGSYQGNPVASLQLVEKESAATKESGIGYAQVSEHLQQLMLAVPDLAWFAADGMHPGKDLALLNALLVYQALHSELPEATRLQVTAPIYGENTGLKAELRSADDPAPDAATPVGSEYTSATVAMILETINQAHRR